MPCSFLCYFLSDSVRLGSIRSGYDRLCPIRFDFDRFGPIRSDSDRLCPLISDSVRFSSIQSELIPFCPNIFDSVRLCPDSVRFGPNRFDSARFNLNRFGWVEGYTHGIPRCRITSYITLSLQKNTTVLMLFL